MQTSYLPGQECRAGRGRLVVEVHWAIRPPASPSRSAATCYRCPRCAHDSDSNCGWPLATDRAGVAAQQGKGTCRRATPATNGTKRSIRVRDTHLRTLIRTCSKAALDALCSRCSSRLAILPKQDGGYSRPARPRTAGSRFDATRGRHEEKLECEKTGLGLVANPTKLSLSRDVPVPWNQPHTTSTNRAHQVQGGGGSHPTKNKHSRQEKPRPMLEDQKSSCHAPYPTKP